MRVHKHRWYDIINYFAPYFRSITVQDSTTKEGALDDDRLELTKDGPWLYGDSTVWDDIQSSLIGQRLSTTPGTVDYNYDNNSITFEPSGSISSTSDRVIWNYQHPHSAKQDGYLNVHIHWEQYDTTVRTWTLQYRVQV